MYNIAICDDNEMCRRMNLELIGKYKTPPGKQITVTVFSSGMELIKCNINFDVVFLDIDMPTISGMEVANILREKGYEGYIVFATFHTAPVYEAFKHNAFRYLVKPVDQTEMFEALDSIFKEIEEKKEQYLIARVDSKNIVRIDVNEIRYIETLNRKTIFHLNKHEVETVMKMKELEVILKEYTFFKTHKCYMLNLKYVQSFDKTSVTLADKTFVPISRLRLSSFKSVYYDYIKE